MLAQAVILVGGLGTRLGELTATTPKPLLPVAGKPFVEHLVQELSRYGIERVTLLAGRFGDRVRAEYDGRILSGLSIEVVVEPAPLGTGGALAHASGLGALDPEFLLLNGDSWIDVDLVTLVRQWRERRARDPQIDLQVLLQHVPDAARFGRVLVADGYVTAFSEKSADWGNRPGQINAGVYIVDRRCIGRISPDRPSSLETEVLPPLVAERRVVAAEAPPGAFFIDIGLPATYAQADVELLRHRRRPALFLDRDGTLNRDRGYTHRPEDLVWQPEAREAVRHANAAGYYVFVVTNQAGVARGYYDEAAIRTFHAAMQRDLFKIGAHVDAFEWCPFHIEGTVEAYRRESRRRKPAPGMIEDLLAAWPVDPERSLLIGDSDDDMTAAAAAGIRAERYAGGSLLAAVRRHVP